MDEITVALDSAGDLLAEVRGAVKRVLDGLHGKVSVTPINDLENMKKLKTLPFGIFIEDVTHSRDWTIT